MENLFDSYDEEDLLPYTISGEENNDFITCKICGKKINYDLVFFHICVHDEEFDEKFF